jgi:hypothetical protein
VLTASLTTRAEAQIADVQRSAVADISRLTFGYLCDDTFVLRNDGDKAVTASLGVAKSGEQTALALAAHEQVQFTSKSKEDVELWVDGKLVAKAEKEKRGCKDVQGNASVAVAPLEVSGDTDKGRRSLANYPYFDPWFYGAYGPWGAWGGGFGAWGYRPFYTGYVGVPIIVGNRGGGGRRR